MGSQTSQELLEELQILVDKLLTDYKDGFFIKEEPLKQSDIAQYDMQTTGESICKSPSVVLAKS